jgi:murein DD-endopeptidase MepM/ murein hydrolase activator NlpD
MRPTKFKIKLLLAVLLLAAVYWLPTVNNSSASRIDELKEEITERSSQLELLQKEIDEYQNEIDKLGKKEKTLKNQIRRLNTTLKKLKTDIRITENKIETANLNIERLFIEINDKQNAITENKETLAETIREINDLDSRSLVEITLAHDNFSDFFNDLERLESFQKDINLTLQSLKALKNELESRKKEEQEEKANLKKMYGRLVDQKSLTGINKTKKDRLLKDTKNKESNYKKLLADRLKKKEALEREISDFEDQLRIEIDPSSLPKAGAGVLAWPLDKIKITQYFGKTPFATKNPQVYNGGGHNGVDFRASEGAPVKAAKSGTVVDTGNTDTACRGVSYGKWVLIRHANNLTTLYAHLSLIKVSKGESVILGQTIGYSGDTGYTTGPHLHFGVFASQAVSVGTLKSKVCGTNMKLPLAPHNGYLNPLSYL